MKRALVVILAAMVGCNLVFGIEEHDVRPTDLTDASDDAEAVVDAGPVGEKCSSDSDCRPPNGCYKSHCDTTLGTCRYVLCEGTRACAAAVCNPQTLTCEDERDYGFRAASYPLAPLTLGCAKNPSACVGAAYPFLFVGTKDEVVAVRVDDMRATTARTTPIVDLKVRPGQIVTSGRRIWIIGDVQGTEPPYVLPIASIDVPADPTLREIKATSSSFKYPYPTAAGFPAPNGGLYVSLQDATQGLPTMLVPEPLASDGVVGVAGPIPDGGPKAPDPPSPPTHVMHRIASLPAGATLVASSASRLVAYRFPITFNIVTEPGTDQAAAQADITLAPPLPAYLIPRFGQGPDGVVMLSAPINADPVGDCNCTSHTRMQWVLSSSIATTVTPSELVDVEGYSNPIATPTSLCHTCQYFAPPSLTTWLDAKSALVAAAASDPAANRALTSVRLVERDPIAANPSRRATTATSETPTGNFATDRIALTATGGLGFLLLADSEGNSTRLSVYDPRCDSK